MGSRGVWGLPHVLQAVDGEHLDRMKAVVASNEDCMHAAAQVASASTFVVNLWVGLTGPAVLAGHFYRSVRAANRHLHIVGLVNFRGVVSQMREEGRVVLH